MTIKNDITSIEYNKLKSPLRYPGGKQKICKTIENDILSIGHVDLFLECFSGGASVSLFLLLNNVVNNIILNDKDILVYSFWKCVFTPEYNEKLLERINTIDVNLMTWEKIKNSNSIDIVDMAFKCLFLNRTNFSGILKAGPIGGKKQLGKYLIDCRWNKDKLIYQIKTLALFSNRVRVENLDYQDFIKKYHDYNKSQFWYFDPPYYYKANQLYNVYFNIGEHKIFKEHLSKISDKYIISYDDCFEIRDLFKDYKIETIYLKHSAMINDKRRESKKELYIKNF
jgi:DNA adenine methylase